MWGDSKLGFVSRRLFEREERRKRRYWVHDMSPGPNRHLLYQLLFGHAI